MGTTDNFQVPAYPYKRIRVFPDRDLRASFLEIACIDTQIFQRLRYTKQLGNSNISYPTADHSRFAHSLGVLYWSNKILDALKSNHSSSQNKKTLDSLNEALFSHFKTVLGEKIISSIGLEIYPGLSWFDQLVRLYGLLHDISHIPFGHTIEDQAKLCLRHDDDIGRLTFVFQMLKDELDSTFFSEYHPVWKEIASEYLNLIEKHFVIGQLVHDKVINEDHYDVLLSYWNDKNCADLIEPIQLSYDIVSNTICADLIDYSIRDTLFVGMPKTFDKALLTYMKILSYKTTIHIKNPVTKQIPRLGVNVSRKKVRHDVITAILELLRIRYDLTEKVYYHHAKIVADMMLEKVLRLLKEDPKIQLKIDAKEVYKEYLGDEGFMIYIKSKLEGNEVAQKVYDYLVRRKLYKACYRISAADIKSKTAKEGVDVCENDQGRSEMESKILEQVRLYGANDLKDGDIIISFLPKKMQKKIAKALIEWSDGSILAFDELPTETNYSNEVTVLTQRYESLWSMTVFVNPEKVNYLRSIEQVCENIFDLRNNHIQRNYLREKYEYLYQTQEFMQELSNKVLNEEAEFIAEKTAAKGSYTKEDLINNNKHSHLKNIKIGETNSKKKNSKDQSALDLES